MNNCVVSPRAVMSGLVPRIYIRCKKKLTLALNWGLSVDPRDKPEDDDRNVVRLLWPKPAAQKSMQLSIEAV